MSKATKIILGLVVIVVVVFLVYKYSGVQQTNSPTANLTSQTQPSNEPIKIGYLGPLTGDAASIGLNMVIPAQMAIDELNKNGGINGRLLTLVQEDAQCNPKEAVTAGQKLINVEKVTAIIGGICSSETLAVAPLANQAKVPLISGGSTAPSVSNAGDYVFRFVPSDNFQGKFSAEYIVNKLGKKKVALLYCLSDYCMGIRDAFKKSMGDLGGEVMADEGFKQDTNDLRTQLTKIKSSNPEAIYFLSYPNAAIIGFKQMEELGLNVSVFGPDAFDDPTIPQKAGADATNGAKYFYAANQQLPQTFIDEMNKRSGGKEMIVYSPRVYDIMNVLADIIKRVGPDGEKIKGELYKVKDYKGIADTYTLDANGDLAVAKYAIKEYKDGKAVEVKE